MSIQPGQDPDVLRQEAYADDTHLDVRRCTHQLYTVDPVDFDRWTLERLPWRGNERVLDVGCGPGDLLCEMAREHEGWDSLVGCDLSAGMIAEARAASAGLAVQWFAADAQALPFPDASFDVVMACHMLYHVPDIDRAIVETARVLRPGGRFLATTNGAHTMAEYRALLERAATRFPAMVQSAKLTDRFSLENAPGLLAPHIDQVQVHTLPGTLRFPSAQPLMDYFVSARALSMHPDHTDAEWQAVVDFVRAETEAVIACQGHFDVTKITGAVTGVKGG
ncbi:MAG: methyltransferase domain-containing protein [Anaerolineae bacterium]|jgi:SAM-dependent methyltransferase